MDSSSVQHGLRELPSDEWPPLLCEIPDPPARLYIRGTRPAWDDGKFLCVIGARRHTSYGKEVCEKLITGLRGLPITVVSGLALGIDSIAHHAALAAGLRTIAIPGSGLAPNVLYPASHRALAEKVIADGGALISEFAPDFKATPWSFPQRNRIMAGLSHAVMVIEAEQRSGSLITSRLATEYNREVLTVPGSIFAPNSAGPHLLIRLGATPITSAADILTALGFSLSSENDRAAEKDYADCSPAEKKILGLLREPLAKDLLVERLGLPVGQINALLTVLEIKGHIKEDLGEIHLA